MWNDEYKHKGVLQKLNRVKNVMRRTKRTAFHAQRRRDVLSGDGRHAWQPLNVKLSRGSKFAINDYLKLFI